MSVGVVLKDGVLFKVRLYGKGFYQVEVIDYHEVFPPVLSYVALHILIYLAAQCLMYFQQFNQLHH